MEVNDNGLDERLRALAAPPPEVVERVAVRALAASPRNRHLQRLVTAASACCVLLLVMIGVLVLAAPLAADAFHRRSPERRHGAGTRA